MVNDSDYTQAQTKRDLKSYNEERYLKAVANKIFLGKEELYNIVTGNVDIHDSRVYPGPKLLNAAWKNPAISDYDRVILYLKCPWGGYITGGNCIEDLEWPHDSTMTHK